MIDTVNIYGERCSGTTYLENLINLNFDTSVTWKYGWKHFFGFNNLDNSDDTLFICIVRNPYDWINSLYRDQHHLPRSFRNIDNFLSDEFYSINQKENISEIMGDRNIFTHERYKNIFEARHVKNQYLIDVLPTLVKNYILIRYEDLLEDFDNTMNKIKNTGLAIKNDIQFPLNITYYKFNKTTLFKKNSKVNHISIDMIKDKFDMEYENILEYQLPIEIIHDYQI
jgi:hypothetical protein